MRLRELGCALPSAVSQHSLGLVDEVISLVPVCQQVRGLLVVHADVVIREQAWEEVVDFPGDVQDVINAVGSRRDTLSCHGHHTGTEGHWEPMGSNPTELSGFTYSPKPPTDGDTGHTGGPSATSHCQNTPSVQTPWAQREKFILSHLLPLCNPSRNSSLGMQKEMNHVGTEPESPSPAAGFSCNPIPSPSF